ncbi:unnamed protein product [Cylindrotheca closterium]|uniref:Uncharacterized protein n=1 Tax=Cylindrotheca closterium TaxID=2856 RepID=A0AAD2JKD3_9STRA|nr:unnamed protein product [Cylindrotheca closterium]
MMYNESKSPLAALTRQIGGEGQIISLIMTFSESVLQDLDMEAAFKGMDAEALADHMTNLITRVFGYTKKSSMTNSIIRCQIVLRSYALFELGLSRGQLHKLQLHFESAMRDSKVEGDVFEHCKDRFTDICIMFNSRSRSLQRSSSSNSIHDPAGIMIRAASNDRLKGGLQRSSSSRLINDPARTMSKNRLIGGLQRSASVRSILNDPAKTTTVPRPSSKNSLKGCFQRSSSSRSIRNDPAKIIMVRNASNDRLKGGLQRSSSSRSILNDQSKIVMARAASSDLFKGLQRSSSSRSAMLSDPARVMMVQAASNDGLKQGGLQRSSSSRSILNDPTKTSSSSRAILDDRAKILMIRAASNRRECTIVNAHRASNIRCLLPNKAAAC